MKGLIYRIKVFRMRRRIFKIKIYRTKGDRWGAESKDWQIRTTPYCDSPEAALEEFMDFLHVYPELWKKGSEGRKILMALNPYRNKRYERRSCV